MRIALRCCNSRTCSSRDSEKWSRNYSGSSAQVCAATDNFHLYLLIKPAIVNKINPAKTAKIPINSRIVETKAVPVGKV